MRSLDPVTAILHLARLPLAVDQVARELAHLQGKGGQGQRREMMTDADDSKDDDRFTPNAKN